LTKGLHKRNMNNQPVLKKISNFEPTLKSHFCHKITKTQNSTKDIVFRISFSELL
jgi:hypothetical protein